MRITGPNHQKITQAPKSVEKKLSSQAGATPATSHKDEVTIAKSTPPQTMPDFIETLEKALTTEVRTGVSQHDLQKLQEKVQLGEYYININAIAKKMLMDQESDNN